MYDAAASVLGYTRRHNVDWFDDKNGNINLVIEKINKTLAAKLSRPSAA